MTTPHFDIVVLGAGPGGYTAAVRSAQLGKTVAIVEKRYWGGVCLNVGCVPSKSLIHSADVVRTVAAAAEYGIAVGGEVTADFGAAVERSRAVADGRVKGIHYLMSKNGITEFDAHGSFTGPTSMVLTAPDNSQQTITFDTAIIAVGAETRLLPGTALSERVVSYEEQILDPVLPKSIVVAGAGAIGIEFAYILNSYGVDVTVVEFADRVLPLEDVDVSKELAKRYKKLGITVMTKTRVTSVTESAEGVRIEVESAKGTTVLEADRLMQAVGFAPRVTGYGLETTGVALTERGAIAVDDAMLTSVPTIAAIGDVTGKLMLAHVAEAMAMVAAESLSGTHAPTPLEYTAMPRATYAQPQVASFGPTEEQARASAIDVRVSTFPFMANAKAHAIGEPGGFVKLLTDAATDTLVGAHLIGPEVTELLPELTLAFQQKIAVGDLARNVHAHPTLSEAVKEALHGAAGHLINL